MNLTIDHVDDLPKTPRAPTSFTGTVYFQTLVTAKDGSPGIGRVNFEHIGGRSYLFLARNN